MNWYAIYTKPKAEDTVSAKLRQVGVEVYNPKLTKRKYVRNHYCEIIEPLFPCYIFGKFEPDTHFWMITYTRGVRKVVGGMNGSWPVAEEIIDCIRSYERGGIVTLPGDQIAEGDTVRIADGLLAGLTCVFSMQMKGSERVILLLNAIGYQAKVVVDGSVLRKVC